MKTCAACIQWRKAAGQDSKHWIFIVHGSKDRYPHIVHLFFENHLESAPAGQNPTVHTNVLQEYLLQQQR